MLAGGLVADNVIGAIRKVRPWAVDVSSGVEATPGVKSAERMTQFFQAVASEAMGNEAMRQWGNEPIE